MQIFNEFRLISRSNYTVSVLEIWLNFQKEVVQYILFSIIQLGITRFRCVLTCFQNGSLEINDSNARLDMIIVSSSVLA